MDCHGLRIDGSDHLLARLHFDQLCACLPDLVVEIVSMALLDDDFVSGKVAHVGDDMHARLEVFGHHAGVANHHRRGRAARHQSGVARGQLTQLGDKFSRRDFQFVDQDEMFVAPADQLHNLGRHHRSTDDRHRAINVDQGSYAKFFVDVPAPETEFNRYDGVAVDPRRPLGFLPNIPAARSSVGANIPPAAAPSSG